MYITQCSDNPTVLPDLKYFAPPAPSSHLGWDWGGTAVAVTVSVSSQLPHSTDIIRTTHCNLITKRKTSWRHLLTRTSSWTGT